MFLDFIAATDSSAWIWLILILATLGLEIMTVDLVSIWFCLGALVALILNLLGVDIAWQIAAFIITSVLLLATVGRWSRRILKNKVIATNADSLIGQEVIITKSADHLHVGEGKVRGIYWTVLCDKNETVTAGDIAIVKRLDGNKLIVKK